MRGLKVALCLFLVFSFVFLPTMQRVHAVVTVTTVVGVLILTVLAAMGITLVVKDMQKDSYVLQQGDSFMQSKGYSGSFAEWVAGGTDVDVALKTGFLVLSKSVVDRIKEFVSWLIPGATSDTVVDIGSGQIVANPILNLTSASITFHTSPYNPSIQWYNVGLDSKNFLSSLSSFPLEITDANNTLNIVYRNDVRTQGYYDLNDSFVYEPYRFPTGSSADYLLVAVSSSTVVHNSAQNKDILMFPGVYISATVFPNECRLYPRSEGSEGLLVPFKLLELDNDLVSTPINAGAIIGSYDDLSDLQDQDGENKFYITQDGQALNPSSQDLADIIGALQQSLDDINRKLDVMPWTAAAEEAGTVSPDYTDFELGNLDFSSLGALITTRFPFSIPWDMVRIFELFVADPVPPRWEVDILPIAPFEDVNTTLVLDMGQYPIVGLLSRWFCIIDLCLGLVFVTKKLVWTA